MPRRSRKPKEKTLYLNLFSKNLDSGEQGFEVAIGSDSLRKMKTDRYTSQLRFGPFTSQEELHEFMREVGREEGFTHYELKQVSLEAIKTHRPDEIQGQQVKGVIETD